MWVLFSIANLYLHPLDDKTTSTLARLPYLGILALCVNRSWPRHREWILKLAVLGLAPAVLLSLYHWFFRNLSGSGFFGNSAFYAYNLFFAFLFFCEGLRRPEALSPLPRPWFYAGAILSLTGILFSETRFIWLLVIIYMLFLGLPWIKERWGFRAVILVLTLGTAVAGGLYLKEPRIQEKMFRAFYSTDASRDWRFRAWEHNWTLFKSQPLTGVGPENNGINTARDTQYAGHWNPGYEIYAHSIYFQSLGENGLIGSLILFAALALLAFTVPALRIYLIFFALAGVMDNIFQNSKVVHAFYFYALLTCLFLSRRKAA